MLLLLCSLLTICGRAEWQVFLRMLLVIYPRCSGLVLWIFVLLSFFGALLLGTARLAAIGQTPADF